MIRVAIALLAIGLMSLTAFAQPSSAQTPEQNEAARKATAERIVMGEKQCAGCDLFQVDLSYKELSGLDLSHTRLRQADLSLAAIDRSNFKNSNMSVVNAFGARFENSDFSGVNFTDATLVGAWFGGANLADANFSNANLSGAYLATAKGLTQMQLNAACGDDSTKLPKGLNLPACKAG
jgi:uncharacterized protein YjbI with pentapeptide repeats